MVSGKQCYRKLVILFVMTLAAFLPAATQAQATECYVYDISLEGTVSGNPFQRSGVMVFYPATVTDVTENGINPFEIWFASGSPALNPEVGSIIFMSNSAFAPPGSYQRAQLDMVGITVDENYLVTITPDASLASLGMNYFNASSGLLGSIYQLYGGATQLQFQDDGATVVGTMQLIGKGAYYYTNVPYNANFVGSYRETTTACLIPTI